MIFHFFFSNPFYDWLSGIIRSFATGPPRWGRPDRNSENDLCLPETKQNISFFPKLKLMFWNLLNTFGPLALCSLICLTLGISFQAWRRPCRSSLKREKHLREVHITGMDGTTECPDSRRQGCDEATPVGTSGRISCLAKWWKIPMIIGYANNRICL